MALAEARAAWQRTANRCWVQEDAKRAPKLACCSSVPPPVKEAETGPTNASDGQDIPGAGSLPFDRNPSYSNFSPNSRWWLQLQPNYGYQKGLMDEQFTPLESNNETCQTQKCSGYLARNEDDSGLSDQSSLVEFPFDNQYRSFVNYGKKDFTVKEEKLRALNNRNCRDPLKLDVKEDVKELCDEVLVSCEVSKNVHDLYFDSESSWIGAEKSTPWWRTADTEELALLVAQKSLDLIENCDLPRPRITYVKKDLNVNIFCFHRDEISTSSLHQNPGTGNCHHLCTHDSTSDNLNAGSSCKKLRMSAEGRSMSGGERSLRHSPTHERTAEVHTLEDDAGKAQLLKALHHSQTRAREAEKVAKQASAEKEHILKLVLRQASELFAYKQWIQLLQLENTYFQFKNNNNQPEMLPWTPLRSRKMRNGWQKSSSRKRANRSLPWYDVGKYAVVFALGLGLVGAGLLLGWTIGWMLPMW